MIKIIKVYKDSRILEMTPSSNIGLGVKTDNEVDILRFKFDEFYEGTATLLTDLKDSQGNNVAFPLTMNEELKSYELVVTNYLASQLNFTIQLEIVHVANVVWHSKQAMVRLDDCLNVGEGDMPTTVENWLQSANIVLEEMREATTEVENVNIEVEDRDNTYYVTITDRNGVEHEAVIYQGANAIISGASASVDDNIGIPSVNVTMGGTESDRTFDFAFHNLKGEQGEKGEKGDPGAIKFKIVETLPLTDIEEDTIYLVPITPDTSGNNYAEYIYVNGAWELLGKIGVQVDLSNYYNKSETNTLLNAKENTSNKVTSISSSSTNIQYPSAKCVYDSQVIQDTKITNLENQVFGDETIEGEGTSITLNGTLKGQFNSIELKGNTSQTGTPTPSTPINVNVVSGDNTITISNEDNTDSDTYLINLPVENIFDVKTFITNSGGTYTENSDGSITTNTKQAEYSTPYVFSTTDISVSLSGIITLGTATGVKIELLNSSNTKVGEISTSVSKVENISASKIRFNWTNSSAASFTLKDIMLEKGSKSNTYTPYGTTPIELCKIGDYQDYFYKSEGNWYKYGAIYKYTFTGLENWQKRNTNTSGITTYSLNLSGIIDYLKSPNTILNNNLSDYLTNLTFADGVSLMYSRGLGFALFYNPTVPNDKVLYINCETSDLTTFKNDIVNHYLIVVIATATSTQITYQPLIDQLNNLEKAMSKDGQTNISQVNNDLPFIISASVFLNNINGKIALLNKLVEG